MRPHSSVGAAAVGVGAVAIVAFGSSVGGTAPGEQHATVTDTDASAPGQGDDFVLPSGYTMLVDDTGRLTIAVPESWNDVDTAPTEIAGAEVPRIGAGGDVEAEDTAFDASGVLYMAVPFTADEEALYRERFELATGCASNEVVPYDDGAFLGEWWRQTECGPSGEGESHVIVASPASEVATVVVIVQLAGPQDQPVLDAALESFNFTPTAAWPAPATAASSTTTTSTTFADVVSSAPAATLRLVNNSGLISVDMPVVWDDIETTGGVNDDGSYRPSILAAPSLDEFGSGFNAPGARVSALPPDGDPASAMANALKPDDCETTGPTAFDNGELTGLSQMWVGCAGGAIDVVLVAASPPDDSFVVHAKIQQEAGGGLASTIVESLAVVDATTYPPTTSPPDPATTGGAVPASLWEGAVQGENVIVIDNQRRLRVQVPTAWRDFELHPSFNDDASPRPRIIASLHIDTMNQQWEVPGVIFLEFPYVDAASFLTNRLEGTSDCNDGGTQTFDNGEYRGLMHTWINCGGTSTRVVTLVASPPDNSATLYVEVRLPTDDDTALHTVLTSFGQL